MNMNDFDFSKSAIIKPPGESAALSNNFRYYYIVVDSRDRNMQLYPNPACYVVDMPCDMANVKKATLMHADIPSIELNVTGANNAFSVRTDAGGAFRTATLDPGMYTFEQLCAALQLSVGGAITVTFDDVKKRFAFHSTSDSAFELDFTAKNSIARVLGFAPLVYTAVAGSAAGLTSPFAADIDSLRNPGYTLLNIDNFNAIAGVSSAASASFAVIDSTAHYSNTDDMFTKHFNPTLPRLHQLRVRFTNYYGSLVDFQNRDHYFVLRLACLKSNLLW